MSPSSLERDLEVTGKKKIFKSPAPCASGVNLGTWGPCVYPYALLLQGQKAGVVGLVLPSCWGPGQGQEGPF